MRHTLTAALLLVAAPALAQDPMNGAELAQEYCAGCYDIGASARPSSSHTPQNPPMHATFLG